jgi:hypothetical protein
MKTPAGREPTTISIPSLGRAEAMPHAAENAR